MRKDMCIKANNRVNPNTMFYNAKTLKKKKLSNELSCTYNANLYASSI
jgi:hypothetical protein